jgi:hypothetical protein
VARAGNVECCAGPPEGDWEDVYRSGLRFTEGSAALLAVPVSVVTFVEREAGAGAHTYRFGARVPIDAA